MKKDQYVYAKIKETQSKARGISLPISTKVAVLICNWVRHKKVAYAKRVLDEVIAKKTPVPFTKFNDGVGHRKGKIAAGRYPVKAATEIRRIISSAEANAVNKGLDSSSLVVSHICAQRGPKQIRYGRQRGRQMKRTHIEVIIEEAPELKKKQPAKKEEKKAKEEQVAEQPKEEAKKAAPSKKAAKPKTPAKAAEPKAKPAVKKEEPKAPAKQDAEDKK